MDNNFWEMFDDELEKNPWSFDQWKQEKRVPRTRTKHIDVIDIALRHDISLVKLLIHTIVEKWTETPREEEFIADMQDFEITNQQSGSASFACLEALRVIETSALRAIYTIDAWIPFSEFELLEKSKKTLQEDKKIEEDLLDKYAGECLVWIKIAQSRAKEIIANQDAEDNWNDINIAIQDMISSLRGWKIRVNPFEELPEIQKAFLNGEWTIPDDFARDATVETSINHAFIQANNEISIFSDFMENLLKNSQKVYPNRASF